MKIALIAHDKKKDDIIRFSDANKKVLKKHELYATGTTGKVIAEKTKLSIHRFQSGPQGGDQQIGAMIANHEMDVVIFLRDPLTAQPHEPDVSALMRLCDVHAIPLATNITIAEILMYSIERSDIVKKHSEKGFVEE
ncbi:methylglyoxal synthase [Oceanobacillus halotolerans]|uniref:methylglyoxal synthase n=1 Tax=Oceanobacillus halotolerans TaxID=2663380 RepID=UPI0013D9C0D6|nr:methylglyoxal synthase [Oceanobacillus halotolerans]